MWMEAMFTAFTFAESCLLLLLSTWFWLYLRLNFDSDDKFEKVPILGFISLLIAGLIWLLSVYNVITNVYQFVSNG